MHVSHFHVLIDCFNWIVNTVIRKLNEHKAFEHVSALLTIIGYSWRLSFIRVHCQMYSEQRTNFPTSFCCFSISFILISRASARAARLAANLCSACNMKTVMMWQSIDDFRHFLVTLLLHILQKNAYWNVTYYSSNPVCSKIASMILYSVCTNIYLIVFIYFFVTNFVSKTAETYLFSDCVEGLVLSWVCSGRR